MHLNEKADKFDLKIHAVLDELRQKYPDIEIEETDNNGAGYSAVNYKENKVSKEVVFTLRG